MFFMLVKKIEIEVSINMYICLHVNTLPPSLFLDRYKYRLNTVLKTYLNIERCNISHTILDVLFFITAEHTKVKKTYVVCLVLAVTLGNTLTTVYSLH